MVFPNGDEIANVSDLSNFLKDFPITQSYHYDAFGNHLGEEKSNDTNYFRYCGEYWDKETGEVYLRARYYNPKTGRFATVDPAMDGTNWYVYCNGNPINFVDPWGLAITLPGITDKNDERFVNLQLLTDDTLDVDLETGIVSYAEGESIDREISTNLVRDVINNDINCDLVTYDKQNGLTSWRADNGNITNLTISITPNYTPSQWSYVDGEGYGYRTKPAFMVMGHELVHAVHLMTDTAEKNNDQGYYLGGPEPGKTWLRKGRLEELNTTGIV